MQIIFIIRGMLPCAMLQLRDNVADEVFVLEKEGVTARSSMPSISGAGVEALSS